MTPEEFLRGLNDAARRRRYSDEDPDWIEAHLNLIDALRIMIRVDKRIGKELLDEEGITREQYDDGMREVAKMQEALDALEAHEIDPTLYGTIKG